LIAEQRAEMERWRQADPDRRSFVVASTPLQREAHAWKDGQALAGRDEDQEHFRKMQKASEEPTFSGELRRALNAIGPHMLPAGQTRHRLAVAVRLPRGGGPAPQRRHRSSGTST